MRSLFWVQTALCSVSYEEKPISQNNLPLHISMGKIKQPETKGKALLA